jgi:crooked neck
VALLEVWKTFEENHGSPDEVKKVEGMMPIVSKRRVVDQETGQTVEGMFIYFPFILLVLNINQSDWDLVFADDERESNPTTFKFLQMAHAWRQHQAASKAGGEGGAGSAVLSGFTPAAAQPANDEASSDEEAS